MRLPDDLQSDTPDQRLAVKGLQTMDLIHRQLDRIGYLRSAGHHWGPAVEHLRSLLVGLEDLEFWDGLPKEARKEIKSNEKAAADLRKQGKLAAARLLERDAKRLKEVYSDWGWNTVSVNAVAGPGGRARFRPTAQDLDQMMQILMRLMDRKKLVWKTRGQSALPPVQGLDDGANGVDDGMD